MTLKTNLNFLFTQLQNKLEFNTVYINCIEIINKDISKKHNIDPKTIFDKKMFSEILKDSSDKLKKGSNLHTNLYMKDVIASKKDDDVSIID